MQDELKTKVDEFTVGFNKITDMQVRTCELTAPPSESEPLLFADTVIVLILSL